MDGWVPYPMRIMDIMEIIVANISTLGMGHARCHECLIHQYNTNGSPV